MGYWAVRLGVGLWLVASLVSATKACANVAGQTASKHNARAAIQVGQISVFGQGQLTAQPDVFTFTISVVEQGEVVGKLYQAIRAKSKRITEQLLHGGVVMTDIQAMHVQLQPRVVYGDQAPLHKGFVLTREIRVSAVANAAFDVLIDKVIRAGASSINQFQYQISQPSAKYLQALESAMSDAKMRAEKIAASMQARVGEVIRVQELRGNRAVGLESRVGGSGGNSYLPGVLAVNAEVEVTFALHH